MKVYIIRHGQVPHNALKQYNTTDEDLTVLGIKQAEELRDKIKDMKLDIIICSPLNRAKHTAEIININNATSTELQNLQGIGETLAQNIIDYREENGRFKNIEELMNVPGIGESKFNNIKEQIKVR